MAEIEALPATDSTTEPSWVTSRDFWICLIFFLIAAFSVRLELALTIPTIHRADEVFQSLEPAHRLWSGWGIVTWEWRDGIRSWLFPGFLTGLMELSSQFGLGRDSYLPFIAAALSIVSLGVVVMGTVLGWRHSRLTGAILCGLLCSFWPDLVYFAPKTLTEVQSGNILVVAAGLASLAHPAVNAGRPIRGAVLYFAIGLLLGVVFCLRFQLAPALFLIAVWAARKDFRSGWLPLILGALGPLIALGWCDYLTWGSPFQSVWLNVYINAILHRSDMYGVSPPYWYFTETAKLWGAALLPALIFFCIGARFARLLASTALVVVAFHSLIAHKEISFIYAAIPPAVIVAGMGTAQTVLLLPRMLRMPVKPWSALAGAAVLWLAVMGFTAAAEKKSWWNGLDSSLLPLIREAGKDPALCGLGLYGFSVPNFPWPLTGGYSYLNRPVPIYLLHTPAELAAAQPGIDYLLLDADLQFYLQDYEKVLCKGNYCLMRHPQPCKDVPSFEINAVLERAPTQASVWHH